MLCARYDASSRVSCGGRHRGRKAAGKATCRRIVTPRSSRGTMVKILPSNLPLPASMLASSASRLSQSLPAAVLQDPSAIECRPGFARLHRSLRRRPAAATSGATTSSHDVVSRVRPMLCVSARWSSSLCCVCVFRFLRFGCVVCVCSLSKICVLCCSQCRALLQERRTSETSSVRISRSSHLAPLPRTSPRLRASPMRPTGMTPTPIGDGRHRRGVGLIRAW